MLIFFKVRLYKNIIHNFANNPHIDDNLKRVSTNQIIMRVLKYDICYHIFISEV